MGSKRFPSVFCVVVLSTASALAADNIDSHVASTTAVLAVPSSNSLPSSTGVVEIEPWIHTRMNDGLRDSVEVAFEIAAQRVQEVEACAELFTELGVDAMDTLGSALYMPLFTYRDIKEICGRRILAFTTIGSPLTFICPDFEGISVQHAAKIIIHEALHNAGLEESPPSTAARKPPRKSTRWSPKTVTSSRWRDTCPGFPKNQRLFFIPSFARAFLRAFFPIPLAKTHIDLNVALEVDTRPAADGPFPGWADVPTW